MLSRGGHGQVAGVLDTREVEVPCPHLSPTEAEGWLQKSVSLKPASQGTLPREALGPELLTSLIVKSG